MITAQTPLGHYSQRMPPANQPAVLWSVKQRAGLTWVDSWAAVSRRTGAHPTALASWQPVAGDARNVAGLDVSTLPGSGGKILVAPLVGCRQPHFVGSGHDPTWSPDGRGLFYIQQTQFKAVKFRLRYPIRRRGHVETRVARIVSPVNRIAIIRVPPNGSDRQTVTTTPGYGATSLNVLADDKTVVFEYIASDQRIATIAYARGGITVKQVYKHYPRPLIETAFLGGTPRVLMPGRLPVVQP
jgi:hypothetical protein